MADDKGAAPGNEAGHWERWEIMRLHNELLDIFNRGIYSTKHDFPLPPLWWTDPRAKLVSDRIEAFVKSQLKSGLSFGFKDPRTCKLLPLWKQVFRRLELDPKYIVCTRHPGDVAASLHARDGVDCLVGEYRCLDYLVECLRYTSEETYITIDYDDWFLRRPLLIDRLFEFALVDNGPKREKLRATIDCFIKEDLNRSGKSKNSIRQPLVCYGYELLRNALESNPASAELKVFLENFIFFKQILVPFELEFSRVNSGLATSYAQIQILEAAHQELFQKYQKTQAALAEANDTLKRLSAANGRLRACISDFTQDLS